MKELTNIAFSGRIYAGKDFFGQWMAKEFNLLHMSIGNELKALAAEYFDFMEVDVHPDKKNDVVFKNPETEVEYSTRRVWQLMNVLTEIDPHVYVRAMERNQYSKMSADYRGAVITDVRFPAERQWCKENGFTHIYIVRHHPNCHNETANDHSSESHHEYLQDSADHVFYNIGFGMLSFRKFIRDKGIVC